MGTDVTTGTPLDALDPKQRLALDFYTNPLYGRTFSNKLAAATAAGFADGRVMDSQAMRAAIGWVMEQKTEASAQVAKLISNFAMEAVVKLVSQIGLDHEIEVREVPEELLRPATPIMGLDAYGCEKLIGYDDGHLKLADRIIAQNRAAASLAKESREALKLVLAYHMGTPEQKIRNERTKPDQGDPLDLGDLTDDQLRELAGHVQDLLDQKATVRQLPPTEEETDAS